MSSRMRGFAVACWLVIAASSCGGDDGGPADDGFMTSASDAGDGSRRCVDDDGDGYGSHCGSGIDCDDQDPDVTDECRRCLQPNQNCPCEPGTEPIHCDPEDIHTTQNGVMGVLQCSEGMRYCRDAAWSDCEILWQYATFVPD